MPPRVDSFTPAGRDPVTSSAGGFLWWLLKQEAAYILVTTVLGVMWFLPGAFSPYLLGNVIDRGIVPGDWRAILWWTLALFVVVSIGVLGGILLHTAAVFTWIQTIYRTQKLVVRKVTRLGHVSTRRTPTGEVLSVASSDSNTFGALTEVLGEGIAALIAYLFVGLIVMSESWRLGLVVLIAAPVIVGITGPLMKPFHAASAVERTRQSKLTGMATDIVAGLRILRGIGGEKTFGDNYAKQSQSVRSAGVRAGTWFAGVEASSTLLSGLLLVTLTYLGANEMIAGRLQVGQLISFFGYAIFLVLPMQIFFGCVLRLVAGHVSAAKTSVVLGESDPWEGNQGAGRLPRGAEVVDLASGFRAEPHQITMVVSATPDDSAALADRLGRYLPSVTDVPDTEVDDKLKGRAAKRERADKLAARARLAAADNQAASGNWGVEVGGVDLGAVPLEEVRKRIFVSDTQAALFAGTLQQALDPHGDLDRERVEAALVVASAEDVYEGLPGGWQGQLEERGRGLSGGQRQRVVLARALLVDADVLVLVEPTSAVDAHTEARIAQRLAEARRGHTTVVMTASPLLLRHADRVQLMVDGKVAATGTHAELFASSAAYRDIVRRGMGEEE